MLGNLLGSPVLANLPGDSFPERGGLAPQEMQNNVSVAGDLRPPRPVRRPAGGVLTLDGRLVEQLAEQHQAAPSEYQVLQALQESIAAQDAPAPEARPLPSGAKHKLLPLGTPLDTPRVNTHLRDICHFFNPLFLL